MDDSINIEEHDDIIIEKHDHPKWMTIPKLIKQCIQIREARSERKQICQYNYILQLYMFIAHSTGFISY